MDATYQADLNRLNERNFQRFDDRMERRLGALSTELRGELQQWNARLQQQIVELRAELGQQVAGLRLEAQRDLVQTKASLLRWMFGFWVGTLAPLAGLVIYLTR